MNEKTDAAVTLSVLIPVYNAEAYLDALLQALEEQRQDGVEVVALNDGSSDGSLRICEAYAQRHPDYIRVLSRENRGAIRTRRELFEAARGEWIWIIDADDRIEEHAIAAILEMISSGDCDMILFDHHAVRDGAADYISQLPFEDGAVFSGAEKKELYQLVIRSARLNPLWNKVFRRCCVDFETDYTPFADIIKGNDCFQTIPIVSNADRILYRKHALYRYNRDNEGSLSHTFRLQTYTSMKKLWERKRAYLDLWEIRDSVLADYATRGWEVVIMLLSGILNSNQAEIDYETFFDLITKEVPFSEIIHDLPINKLAPLDRAAARAIRNHSKAASKALLATKAKARRVVSAIKA